jgi:hypothetical protein
METSEEKSGSRREFFIAILIAIVSLTTALAAWRTSTVNSSAGDATRQGLIDSLKMQAVLTENERRAYELGGYARNYELAVAETDALKAGGDEYAALAANREDFLLTSLALPAAELINDPAYTLPNGTFDIQKYLADINAADETLVTLDPQGQFTLAESYQSEVRWLTIGAVLMAFSLFWLALAEVNKSKLNNVILIFGISIYAFGLMFFIFVELIFATLRWLS